MLSAPFAAWLQRRGIHYGWLVVVITFLTLLITAGAMGLPGALILPLGREFGWDTGQISTALALRLLLFGLMAPFSAALIERYGVRTIVLVAIGLLAAGLSLALVMTTLWQLVLFWGVMTGVGSGLTALVFGAIIANRWFSSNRGLVLGILSASSATGQLAFLPLAAWIVEHAGWRAALVPSLSGLALIAVLILLFMRDRPADLGLRPFGATHEAPPPAPAPTQNAFGRAFSLLIDAAGTKPAFWLLFGTFFICGLSTNGLIQTHLIPLCSDFGMPSVEAASVLAMMGVFDLFGTIGSGWLSDRLDNRWLLFWYYGLRGLSLLYLPSSTFTFYGLSLFAVFYGLDWLATVPPTVKLTGKIFGRDSAGVVFGWIFAGHQIGAATAALGAGLTRTAYSTYLPAFYTAGAACLIAAMLAALIGRNLRGARPAMPEPAAQ